METVKEFKTIDRLVRNILSTDDRARNDDKWLTYRVFEEIAKQHGEKIYIPWKIWGEFPAFETVKRCRAKIQNNEGLLLPTDPEVLLRRKTRERTVRAIMRN